MKNKLVLKDLMNVGLFVVLYYVTFFIGMCFGYIPVLMSVISLITGILCGIPFLLFLSKVKKPGMILLFGLVCGLISLASGSGLLPLLTALIASVLTEILMKAFRYTPSSRYILAYTTFCLWSTGYGLRLYLASFESYHASLVESYGEAYVEEMLQAVSLGGFAGNIILCLAGGLIGGLIGYAVFRKHFRKIAGNA